ncbi:MAG: phosphate transport system regulatory protein PhoU [Gammaproteobacteria bacterium]|nr:MAG: phosphate transport system regulatory protein PhoU [Gammaproteobacteria bacterium]
MSSEDFTHHISKRFNDDLEEIRTHILNMGGMVEKQVVDSVNALVDVDSGLAMQVISTEKQINGFERLIDEECTRLIALRQPAASDLRLIVAVTKANVDLERVGDEANKIAKMAVKLSEGGQLPRGYIEVRHIGTHVTTMLHQALDAFARYDVELAAKVVKEDKDVDVEYESAMRQLVTFMMEDPRYIKRVLNVMWSLRALERIGDHARNIAEQVIYLVKGQDIRHMPLSKLEEQGLLNSSADDL